MLCGNGARGQVIRVSPQEPSQIQRFSSYVELVISTPQIIVMITCLCNGGVKNNAYVKVACRRPHHFLVILTKLENMARAKISSGE